jgi:putative glutamine amidotransferase
MAAPLIGITAGIRKDAEENPRVMLGEVYVTAVLRAGGVPLLIPTGVPDEALDDIRARLDGLIVTGGPDIETSIFHGEDHPAVYGVDPRRDSLELNLVRNAAEHGTPLLGICRGIQVINVALGGDLYTHIADQLPGALRHDTDPSCPYDYPAHPVRIEPGSRLESIVGGQSAQVNSWHHQGLRKPAPGARPVAWAPDGLIEAIEVQDMPFGLGVQWHPEWMPAVDGMQAIFRALIAAASK